jgi:hypothetical protein
MGDVIVGRNQGTPSQGDRYSFPLFGNVGDPMIGTLNLPRFTVGLSVWLFSTLNVQNAPNASQLKISC